MIAQNCVWFTLVPEPDFPEAVENINCGFILFLCWVGGYYDSFLPFFFYRLKERSQLNNVYCGVSDVFQSTLENSTGMFKDMKQVSESRKRG